VRLGELCERSGYSTATVKYYLREGILPPGEPVSAREASYDDAHLERLRLVRVLREVSDLPIDAVRAVVAALDAPSDDIHHVLASAVHAVGPAVDPDEVPDDARIAVHDYIRSSGWTVAPDAPALDLLADTYRRVREYWGDVGPEVFDRYLHAFDELAAGDLAVIGDIDDVETTMRRMVVGIVLWDRAMLALRRLAQEHHSRRRFR
jgi:DNA-binding transcriptional MerR regulator